MGKNRKTEWFKIMNSERVYQKSQKLLLKLFDHGISSVQPKKILNSFLNVIDDDLIVTSGKNKKVYKKINKILPICIGKASVDMANTAIKILFNLNDKMLEGIIVVNEENYKKVPGFVSFKSGHPIPNQNGLKASKFVEEKLSNLTKNDLVLLFLSGGGSALLPYPYSTIKLEQKIKLNQYLINSGANIQEINTVRKHLSKIKGGNLLKFSQPAKLHSFILSDVIGDDLSSISSGPTVPDNTQFKDAKKILKKYKIWKNLPTSITSHIDEGIQNKTLETPDKKSLLFKNVRNTLIGSNQKCLISINEFCKKKKINSNIWKKDLEDDVEVIAKEFISELKRRSFKTPVVLISGGESTVKIKGDGKGGRNQELALHFIVHANKLMPELKFTFLSAGTDGRDGPTNAAGAIVNDESIQIIKKKKINLEKELNNNNSYEVLKKINSLVIIEGTNTNVADLQLLMIH